MICGHKELKKIIEISGQLDTLQRIICMDDEIPLMPRMLRIAKGGQLPHLRMWRDLEVKNQLMLTYLFQLILQL